MPKSKRDKKISLTRTEKKPGLETKAALVEKVRGAVDNYARIFVFQVWNSQNIPLHVLKLQTSPCIAWIFKYSFHLNRDHPPGWEHEEQQVEDGEREVEPQQVLHWQEQGAEQGSWGNPGGGICLAFHLIVSSAWWRGMFQKNTFGLSVVKWELVGVLRNECGLLATNQSKEEVIL